MKNYLLAGLLLFSVSVSGQITKESLDEQGLSTDYRFSLKQDYDSIADAKKSWWLESMRNHEERMEWYRAVRFGCFVHWGVYSQAAGVWKGKPQGGYAEHLMRKACIPVGEYTDSLVRPFNPTAFDAEEWMSLCDKAGMKYFIITAKHHDGFAMFPSDAYPYDIRMTSCGKDLMMELRDAARRHGIKFGFYYSHAFDWEHKDAPGNDWMWRHPGGDSKLGGTDWWVDAEFRPYLENAQRYVNEKSIPQIKELISMYDPDILWFDTPAKLPLYMNTQILKEIRKADKDNKIVINGRLVRYGSNNLGDYKNTGDRAAHFFPTEGDWESIPTTNESYGYTEVDSVRKPVSHFVRLIASAVSKGGNILLNIGPKGDGSIDFRDQDILKGIGRWMDKYSVSIYSAGKTDLPLQNWGVTTGRNDSIFLHVYRWPTDGKLEVGGLRSQITAATLLTENGSVNLSFKRNGNDILLDVPSVCPDSMDAVIVLKVTKAVPSDPIRLLSRDNEYILYAFDAKQTGKGFGFGDGKVNRNYVINWTSPDQYLSWTFRNKEKISAKLLVDYNTEGDENGEMALYVDGKEYPFSFVAYPERKGTNSIEVGIVNLDSSKHEIVLKARSSNGKRFMRPIAVRLLLK